MIKKDLLEMKNKDLGLLKKVRKQERLSLETRHEPSISVPDSTSLNQRGHSLIKLDRSIKRLCGDILSVMLKWNIHALFQDLTFLDSLLF